MKTVAELGFGDHAAYLRAFSRALDNYRRAGSIGNADAEAMRRRAALCPPLTFTQTYRDHYHRFADLRPCPARRATMKLTRRR